MIRNKLSGLAVLVLTTLACGLALLAVPQTRVIPITAAIDTLPAATDTVAPTEPLYLKNKNKSFHPGMSHIAITQ
jgi:hypothetical protein